MPIVRKLLLAAVAPFAVAAAAQAPDPTLLPTYDVASVRQNKTEGTPHSNVPLDTGNVYSAIDPSDARTSAGGYFVATNQPLWRYINGFRPHPWDWSCFLQSRWQQWPIPR